MKPGEQPAIVALCAWRENRGGGLEGMQSVLNVLANRARRRGTTLYEEAVRPWQFSSMTALADPQLQKWPAIDDASWLGVLSLVIAACEGTLADITDGATFYYAATMKAAPKWAATMLQTKVIGGQLFFREREA